MKTHAGRHFLRISSHGNVPASIMRQRAFQFHKEALEFACYPKSIFSEAPSTVSAQLGRLIDHKVISFDEKRGYTVKNKPALKRLISKYKV